MATVNRNRTKNPSEGVIARRWGFFVDEGCKAKTKVLTDCGLFGLLSFGQINKRKWATSWQTRCPVGSANHHQRAEIYLPPFLIVKPNVGLTTPLGRAGNQNQRAEEFDR